MVDDMYVLIKVTREEIVRCRRLMDLDDMLTTKFLEARKEIDDFLMPEVMAEYEKNRRAAEGRPQL